ncbi:MAG: ribonuclease H-like domain-containing protein [Planctomycetota bacterium]|jgi:uncharacterized protein YprB with RNaseH-like and TPR domain
MGLVDKLRRISAPAPAAPHVEAAGDLPGERVTTDDGVYRIHRVEFPLDHVHGRHRLSDVVAAPVARLAGVARDPGLASLDLRRCVFFDTETTSLGGGVGTWIFLLGAAWFEDDRFVVEQFFLEDVTGERALLEAVNARFAQFEHVVSFHGKGFDAPRLDGRLIFHRMRAALPESHLDLCLVGRSLYRGAFGDCRLQTFEKRLVGYARADDLPGAECPSAFFDHLQGESGRIPRVFKHNCLDVLTLPVVAACFARTVEEPDHPVLQSNLGAFFESVGRDRDARQMYERALDGLRGGSNRLLGRTLERLALLERRAGRHAESAGLLLERIGTHPHAFQPLEDLAKYYEHHVRDFAAAEATVLDARSRLVTGKIEVDLAARARFLEALDHRLARIRRRRGSFQAAE